MARILLLFLIAFLYLPFGGLNISYAEIFFPTNKLTVNGMASLRRIDFNGSVLPSGVIPQETSDFYEANTVNNVLYLFTGYRLFMANDPIPDFLKSVRLQYIQQGNWTGATKFPDAPIDPALASHVDYLYYYQIINSASSMGTAGINDVPTSWRRYTGVYRIFLERNELSEAQQLGILDGIDREITAGMGSAYTSGSTTARYIDFQSASSGANAPITKAELQARGWLDVNANESEKFFPDNTATLRRWRILHED